VRTPRVWLLDVGRSGTNNLDIFFSPQLIVGCVERICPVTRQVKHTAGPLASFYVHDHLYSPVALLNESGAAHERYEYDAYGNCHIMDASYNPRSSSNSGNPYLFTGRRVDILDSGSLKIQYNRNRYYDYYTGRWLTQDPLGYVDGMNLYEYACSNPVDTVDPSGSSIVRRMVASVVREVFRYCTRYRGGWELTRVALAGARLADPQCWPGALTALRRGNGNPYAHCVWSCKVAKKHGKKQAEKCNERKEALDSAIADFADSIRDSCWNHLPAWAKRWLAAWACSADQLSDIKDNAAGIECGIKKCLRDKSCEECCEKNKRIEPGTKEGNEDRPYGKRCRPRYLKEMGEGAIAEGWCSPSDKGDLSLGF